MYKDEKKNHRIRIGQRVEVRTRVCQVITVILFLELDRLASFQNSDIVNRDPFAALIVMIKFANFETYSIHCMRVINRLFV